MLKKMMLILLFCSSVLMAETKTYCDKCKKEFEPNTSFSITIKINDKIQKIGSDLCSKCFEVLIKDLEKYNLKISSDGWKLLEPVIQYEPFKNPSIFHYNAPL